MRVTDMNIVFLDYDFANQRQDVCKALERVENTQVISIQDAFSVPADSSVRGVVLTHLGSGLMAYHMELIDRYPQIQHWIFCVCGKIGKAIQETTRNHFAANMVQRDVYCEFFFDETAGFEKLISSLSTPVKAGKKCVIVSNNTVLAENSAEVIGAYLPDWEVAACGNPKNPDYSYCDAVIVVGNDADDLCVPCPDGETVKKWFWFNVPFGRNLRWEKEQVAKLKASMNALGWNLSDYASRTSFSSLQNERAVLQIENGEIHPVALVSDTQFVIWDDYGLPVPQTLWTSDSIQEFLNENTVFPSMAAQIGNRRT